MTPQELIDRAKEFYSENAIRSDDAGRLAGKLNRMALMLELAIEALDKLKKNYDAARAPYPYDTEPGVAGEALIEISKLAGGE